MEASSSTQAGTQAPSMSNRGTAAADAWSQHISEAKNAGGSGVSSNAVDGKKQAPLVSNRGTEREDALANSGVDHVIIRKFLDKDVHDFQLGGAEQELAWWSQRFSWRTRLNKKTTSKLKHPNDSPAASSSYPPPLPLRRAYPTMPSAVQGLQGCTKTTQGQPSSK